MKSKKDRYIREDFDSDDDYQLYLEGLEFFENFNEKYKNNKTAKLNDLLKGLKEVSETLKLLVQDYQNNKNKLKNFR